MSRKNRIDTWDKEISDHLKQYPEDLNKIFTMFVNDLDQLQDYIDKRKEEEVVKVPKQKDDEDVVE